MKSTAVFNKLLETLRCHKDLKYIKQVFEGRRFDIEPNSLPCLMVETVGATPPERRTSNVDLNKLKLEIFGLSSNNFMKIKKLIVGDKNYKGQLDMFEDMQKVLKEISTLDGTVYDIEIGEVVMDSVDIAKYPVRGFLIPIQITYRQTDGV